MARTTTSSPAAAPSEADTAITQGASAATTQAKDKAAAAPIPDANTSMNSASTTTAGAAAAGEPVAQAGEEGAAEATSAPDGLPSGAEAGETVTTPDGEEIKVRTRERTRFVVRDMDAAPYRAEDMAVPDAPEDATPAETFVGQPSTGSSATERVADPIDRGELDRALNPAQTLRRDEMTKNPEGTHVPLSSGEGGAYRIEDGKRVRVIEEPTPTHAADDPAGKKE